MFMPPPELSLQPVSKLETFSLEETSLSSNNLTGETTVVLNTLLILVDRIACSHPLIPEPLLQTVYMAVSPDSK